MVIIPHLGVCCYYNFEEDAVETLYDRVNDCYRIPVVVRVGDNWYHLRAVIDTGATHTVIAFNALLGNNVNVEEVKG